MSRLVNIDVFGVNIDPLLDVRFPVDCPFMMAFLNIAQHHSIVTPGEEERFKHIPDFLARNMHDRGTLIVRRLKGISDYSVQRLQERFLCKT